MSRALSRRREISMRTALGASRSRIIRQLVTESLVLAALGGVCGLALADWAMPSLLSLSTLPRVSGIALDAPMFLIALTASGVAGLLFGLLPALATSRSSVSTAVRTRDAAPIAWFRGALLVVEIAASVVLLAGAGLLIRSFYKLQTVETGLNVDRVLTARFFLPRASYPVERCVSLYQQMIERVTTLPDVAEAAAVSVFPFSGASANVVFTIPDRPPAEPGNVLTANFSAATAGYFRAMGIPLGAGRGFEATDRATAPFVAVVNQAMADRYFPGQNPIGRFVQILGPTPREIVGVIPNLRQRALNLPPEPEIYAPHPQFPTGGMIIKFTPDGRVAMVLGRRPEAVEGLVAAAPGTPEPPPEPYVFSRPTDVGFDAAGNIFVTDGYGNSRVVKFDKNGRFIKESGTRGSQRGQLNLPHTMAMDANGNVYVGDRSNARVQVFDNDLNVKAIYDNVGNPWAVCISPGPHQYLFVSNSIPDNGLAQYRDITGEIYKMELDGTILGKFGKPGKQMGEFSTVHEIDCRNPNELFVAEITAWRIQKIILRPQAAAPTGR